MANKKFEFFIIRIWHRDIIEYPIVDEWIQSPITDHYRSMAKTNYRGYLKKDIVPLKKYFYALRPLFTIRWLEKYGTAPPIELNRVLELIKDRELLDTIHKLLEKKRVSEEKMVAPAIPVLNKFIESELIRLKGIKRPTSDITMGMTQLNELFHQVLSENLG